MQLVIKTCTNHYMDGVSAERAAVQAGTVKRAEGDISQIPSGENQRVAPFRLPTPK